MTDSNEAQNTVLALFDLAFVQRDAVAAADRYLGETYTQHNPTVPDGPEVLKQLIPQWLASVPELSFDIKRVISQGNLVVLPTATRCSDQLLGDG